MKIVKPFDWEFVTATELNVFIEGVDQPDLQCLLWDKDTFFKFPAALRPRLAQASLREIAPGVAQARLTGLQPWGSCVIGIVSGDQDLTASGVNLGHSLITTVLTAPISAPGDQGGGVCYPMPVVGCEASHYPANVQVPFETVLSTADLLRNDSASSTLRVMPLAQAECCDAGDVLLRACCIGLDDGKSEQLLAQSPFTTSPSYIIAFTDVYSFLPAGLVMPGGATIWGDSAIAAFFNDPELRQYRQMFRAQGEAGLALARVRAMQDILDDNSIEALPGLPMLICNVGYRNHAHWVLNSLLPVFWLQDDIRAGRICVLVPEASSYVIDTLRSLSIPRRAIVVVRPALYRFDRILFPSTLSTHSNHAPCRDVAHLFAQMRQTCLAQGYAPGPERLYITRIGSGTQRTISNEGALIEALRQRGFACVAPHELSFAEEVACFSNARIIVGQLGAGLTNIGFAPPGCAVLEITSHNYTSNDYWFLSYVMGHKFARALFRIQTEDELTLANFSFDVDLQSLIAKIDKLLTTL